MASESLAHDSAKVLLAAFRSIDSFRRWIATHHGIGLNGVRALSRIGEADHVTPKELAAGLELTTGSVTSLIDRLESAGLVTRTPHPNDRRSLQLELTPAGVETLTAVYAAFEEQVAVAVASVPEEHVQAATGYLAAVAKSVGSR